MKYMNKENENARDSVAALGIGAMIVFIALILVAAVASAVIIQTGEKLQQNAQQTGSDTQQEIGGKISIITAWVGAGAGATSTIVLVFETAAGSETIADDSVEFNVICEGPAASAAIAAGDFGGAGQGNQAKELDDATDADTFEQGEVYMVTLAVGSATNTLNCPHDLNKENMLIIMVEGGGTTYESLLYTSTTQGDPIV